MSFPLIQKLARSSGGKILWVSCQSFAATAAKKSLSAHLKAADTPNIDQIFKLSKTGLLQVDAAAWPERPVSFQELTQMRSLAVTAGIREQPLDSLLRFDRYEPAHCLEDAEAILERAWGDYDFLFLQVDLASEMAHATYDSSPGKGEVFAMLDAWIPGLVARLGPEVFALSGEVDSILSGDASAVPSMVHSCRTIRREAGGLGQPAWESGPPDQSFKLRQWLLLLMAYADRLEEVMHPGPFGDPVAEPAVAR